MIFSWHSLAAALGLAFGLCSVLLIVGKLALTHLKSRLELTERFSFNAVFWTRQVWFTLLFLAVGWGLHDIWEYHHTYVLWDLRVVAEPGDVVDVHGHDEVVPKNTFYFERASGPVGQMFPRTFCSKFVPGLHNGYHVDIIAATAESYPIECWNVSPTPLGIVYEKGE